MEQQHWDILADLIERLNRLPGKWQERRATLERELGARGCTLDLEEFVDWFGENSDHAYKTWQRGQFLPAERPGKAGGK